ncbi:MAG: TetR/AcrR family transcriptional regulator [Aeromicrobium sp.]|uniref:TetR/AcrR family transcriptional regulator n=1 Tax=Aeromicrobium sp. TaxID=1871063 RepID=UPI003C362D9D
MTTDGVTTAADRRSARRQEILTATRALFDASGSRDAQIEDIARAVGINRAIIYRHFTGKEELFAEALVGYLMELTSSLEAADDSTRSPADRLGALSDAMIDFGVANPAFVDCGLTLLRRPGDELMEEVGRSVMISLGHAMWTSLTHVVDVLGAGVEAGDFDVPDTVLLSNFLYTQALGIISLARLQISVHETRLGVPVADSVSLDEIKRYARISAVAAARG